MANKTLRAGAWSFGMRAASRVLQLIRTVILARLLVPSDFGLMGIAVIALTLVDTFSRTGFHQALVQKKEDVREYYDSAWTFEVTRGFLLGLVLLLAAPLVAAFFGNPEVASIVRVLAAASVIGGFTNVAIAEFDRNLDFDRVFRLEVSERVAEVTTSVVLALFIRNVWALVVGLLVSKVVRVAVSHRLSATRRHLVWDPQRALELFRFGRWIFGTIVLWFLTSELDDILVGRMRGEADLGLYRMAFVVSQSMLTEVAVAVNLVVFPTFARVQDDLALLKTNLSRAIHLVAFISFPAAAFFIVVGEDLTRIVFGDPWLPMVDALRVLAIAGATRAVSSVAMIMFEGAGDPGKATRLELIRLTILALLLYPLIDRLGLLGAGVATVVASLVVDSGALVRAARFLGAGSGVFARHLIWPAANALFVAVVLGLVIGYLGPGFGVPGLLLVLVAGVGSYLTVAFVAARVHLYEDLTSLMEWISRGERE